jgi:putative aldouronate transport system substrate-binding protein
MFAGCDSKEETGEATSGAVETKATEAPQSMEGDEEETQNEPGTLISEEPLTLTVHMHYQNSNHYNEDYPVFKIVEEMTNIKLENVAPDSATDSVEVYNLMLVSGDLPDIITLPFIGNGEAYFRDALDGVYGALDELIDENAPNISNLFNIHKDIREYMTAADGNLYGLPFFYDVNAPEGSGWFIRTDWLKTLDMEVPTNVDEYYEVLKAFRENDPNGNGEKDEVPFFSRATDPNQLVVLWNAYPAFYDDNGTVKYGPLETNYKEAMFNITKWYSEGLINPEIYTAGGASREKLLSENKGGSTFDWFASTSSYNDSQKDNIPGFEFKPMAPPAGSDGVIRNFFKRSKIVAGVLGWAMSSTNEYPVETIKYFDFWFSQDGLLLTNFGIEGVDYNFVDNNIQFTDKVMKADGQTPIEVLISEGAQIIGMGTVQDIRYELAVMHSYGREGYDLYAANNWSTGVLPTLSYSEDDNETVANIMANVNTYVNEMSQKWVLGAEPIEDTYDEFISTIKEFGIEQVIEIQQKAYDDLNN